MIQCEAATSEMIVVTPTDNRLDAQGTPRFRETMDQYGAGSGRRFLLDLSKVEFIDSIGLGALVAVLKKLNRDGRSLEVCGLHPAIEQMFRLTRMDRVFTIHSSVRDALAEVH